MTLQSGYVRTGVLILLMLILFPVHSFAAKPEGAGEGNKNNSTKVKKEKNKNYGSVSINVYFNSEHRSVIRKYYASEFSAGHCPPGLAKKNNGCLPPGQAKKWRYGFPLPGDVMIYDLPFEILVDLGRPPDGHKFVRIGADILLIAIGTSIVIDAIEDLTDLI